MGLKQDGKDPSSEFSFGSHSGSTINRLISGRSSTHKLLALEEVAVVGVCCRVSRHETKDFRSQRQDGGVGDGGERAGVEQELRDRRRQEEEVRLSWTGRGVRVRMCARLLRGQTLVLLSRMSTPLRDRKRWTLLFLGAFSVEYSSGVWTRGERDVAVYTAPKVPHNIGAVGEKRAGGQVIRCLALSCSSRVPAERKNGPSYPSNPSEKTAGLALCLKPPVQKVVFSVGPSSCY